MDPTTIITTIGLGLKLVDQFRDLAIKFMGKHLVSPAGKAEQTTDEIQIIYGGQLQQEIKSSDIKMDQWDDTRYKALERRVKSNWDLFHELYSQLPELSVDEKSRIKIRMERMKSELCEDFREMVKIYERTLGISLPDHYQLFEVCNS